MSIDVADRPGYRLDPTPFDLRLWLLFLRGPVTGDLVDYLHKRPRRVHRFLSGWWFLLDWERDWWVTPLNLRWWHLVAWKWILAPWYRGWAWLGVYDKEEGSTWRGGWFVWPPQKTWRRREGFWKHTFASWFAN